MQFADKHNDPANPESNPTRFVKISCEACTQCTFDRLHGCCLCGGPFNKDLQRDMGACRAI